MLVITMHGSLAIDKMICLIARTPLCCVPRTLPRTLSRGVSPRTSSSRSVRVQDGSENRQNIDINGDDEVKDFWEGEQWNFLGEVSSVALPILVVLGLLVGIFAAQTYNQDADVFLESPKSDQDSAKLYTFE